MFLSGLNQSFMQRLVRGLAMGLGYTIATAVGFVTLLAVADLALSYGRVHPGVSISETDVGGLSKQEATKKIEKALDKSAGLPLLVTHGSRRWVLNPKELGFRLDAARSVNRAFSVGRRGPWIGRIEDRFTAWKTGYPVKAAFSLDQKLVRAQTKRIARKVDRKPVSSTVVVRGVKVSVLPSRLGFSVDSRAFKLALYDRSLTKDRRIVLPMTVDPAPVTEREAEIAARKARAFIDVPVLLKFGTRSWTLQQSLLGRFLVFRTVESADETELLTELDKARLTAHIRKLTSDFHKAPKDAGFVIRGDKVGIIPSENGQEIDADAAYERIIEVAASDQPHQVLLSTKVLPPQRSTEQARAMGIKEKISSYTTTFSPTAVSRVHNIQLLSDSLDGTIVPPGKPFSFNQTIGPRTAEKGYKEAPIIVNGELVPGLGGGVCQVGTTTFNAIFFAGLPVVERRNHSIYISHYPSGRDATVSWGGPDLKFKNDTAAHILIKADYNRNSVTISLWGTSPQRTVSHVTSPFAGFTAYKTKRVVDPSLPVGKAVIDAEGIPGRQITVKRVVKQGAKVLFEDRFISRYRPRIEVVRVGSQSLDRAISTGAAEQTPGGAPDPSAESDVD